MLTDSLSREITDDMNWNKEKTQRGYAGDSNTIMIGTEADLNDHWVELYQTESIPCLQKFQRVYCLFFACEKGKVVVSSVIDDVAAIESDLPIGDYTVYIAAINLGVDQLSLGEDSELSDEEYKERYDIERYEIFIVAGKPNMEGKIRDVS